jgi:hypothetical protein
MKKIYILIPFLVLFLNGCGTIGSSTGGSSGGGGLSSLISGIFVDDIVIGLDYTCSSGRSAQTDANGEFSCPQGNGVSFYLDGLLLGSVTSFDDNDTVTPHTLWPSNPAAQLNVARLLQGSDRDSNGTTITIIGSTVDLNNSTSITSPTFAQDVNTTLASATDANNTLNQNMANLVADALSFETIRLSNSAQSMILYDLNLSTSGEHGVSLAWDSNDTGALAVNGSITRPSFGSGDREVFLTARVYKGDKNATSTPAFTLTIKEADPSDAQSVADANASLTFNTIKNANNLESNITTNLTLSTSGTHGTTISWHSSDNSIVATNGTVNRPTHTAGDQNIELNATISKGASSTVKSFALTVIALPISDTESVVNAANDLTFDDIKLTNPNEGYITTDLNLSTVGTYGTTISWATTNGTFIETNGTVNRPAFTDGHQAVTLTATFTKNLMHADKPFTLTVISLPATDAESVARAKQNLTFADIKNANNAENNITSNLDLITAGEQNTTIAWASSDAGTIATDGTVNRPSYSTGDINVTLSATISKNDENDTKDFDLTVTTLPITDDESITEAKNALTFDTIKNANTAENDILSDLTLSTSGAQGTTISWDSNNTTFLANNGTITRPTQVQGDQNITLIATLSKGAGVDQNKTFLLTVKSVLDADEAITLAKADLSFDDIKNANSAEDTILTNLNLITVGSYGTTISWATSDAAHIATNGAVSRPAFNEEDANVTLTATIAKAGGTSQDKTFVLLVKNIDADVSSSYSSGYGIYTITKPADSFTYELDLGANTKDVYMVFTNESNDTAAASGPTVTSASFLPRSKQNALIDTDNDESPNDEVVRRDFHTPSRISEFNRVVHQAEEESEPLKSLTPTRPLYNMVGDTTTFNDGETVPNTVNATLKKVVNEHNKTLNIWVEDASFGTGCGKSYCVTQTMVDAMADKFLQAGDDNDIYEWVSNIWGEEWEDTGNPNVIADDNNITILLLDIVEENVAGYFYSRDNYKTTIFADSNEKVMFYIDSVSYAEPDGATWEVTDFYPNYMIATLTHEYQHMIHFYQKAIKQGLSSESDTWLNEMCSMITEDVVADKINSNGPRGVDYSDSSAGSSGNANGNLPDFNSYNYVQLTDWYTGDSGAESSYTSYAISYAFGAYLLRNYGGVALMKDIVDSDKTNYLAVEEAVNAHPRGVGKSFEELLREWGATMLLSDKTDAPEDYRYNTGGWFSSSINGKSYNLGSINMFNYTPVPEIYTDLGALHATIYPHANFYYQVGTGLSGKVHLTIDTDTDVQVTVVVK